MSKKNSKTNKLLAIMVLLLADILSIFFSLLMAYGLRIFFNRYFEFSAPQRLWDYSQLVLLLFGIVLMLLYREGIYTKRYDFWQETERIVKAIFLSGIILLAALAMIKQSDNYSRFVLIAVFAIMTIVLPLQKNFIKRLMFRIGIWKHGAKVVGKDPFFAKHVFTNTYLGYVPSNNTNAKTLFVASSENTQNLESILHTALMRKQEVIFIPMVKNFNFSDAHIVHLFNARSNLIIVENNLMSQTNRAIKTAIDYLLAILIFPFLLLGIGIITWLIKREDAGEVFFKQTRIGQDSREFVCYKFRSMRIDGESLLEEYLSKNPKEAKYYEVYHKYKNDPRITKIGAFLRKTSLDELPQIFNVLKGEMSLIGPRPYMPSERSKIGKNIDIILAVKPGITGLWQVSGRNDVDFMSRVDLDTWYVRNWGIWNDIVILVKTVQVVLGSKGAS